MKGWLFERAAKCSYQTSPPSCSKVSRAGRRKIRVSEPAKLLVEAAVGDAGGVGGDAEGGG